jgi:hypothetical protein
MFCCRVKKEEKNGDEIVLTSDETKANLLNLLAKPHPEYCCIPGDHNELADALILLAENHEKNKTVIKITQDMIKALTYNVHPSVIKIECKMKELRAISYVCKQVNSIVPTRLAENNDRVDNDDVVIDKNTLAENEEEFMCHEQNILDAQRYEDREEDENDEILSDDNTSENIATYFD